MGYMFGVILGTLFSIHALGTSPTVALLVMCFMLFIGIIIKLVD